MHIFYLIILPNKRVFDQAHIDTNYLRIDQHENRRPAPVTRQIAEDVLISAPLQEPSVTLPKSGVIGRVNRATFKLTAKRK